MDDFTRWRSCSGVQRGCVNRIRLWPLRRDDYSGVLIGADGERRSDWPARVLVNSVKPAREEGSIACVQGQMAASHNKP